MRRQLCLFLILAVVTSPAIAARLTGLSITPGVVTVASDAPVAAAFGFALGAPYRLVVDLPAVLPVPLAAVGAGSVTRLRAAMFSPGVARLVIDLGGPLEIVSVRSGQAGLTLALRRVSEADFAAAIKRGRRPLPVLSGGNDFALPGDMFLGERPGVAAPVAVTVAALPETSPVRPAAGAAAPPTVAPPTVVPPTVAPPAAAPVNPEIPVPRRQPRGVKPRSGGRPLVVIDAGHGGKDVGAISIDGAYEKTVTLAIARETTRILERSGRIDVKLTRADDRFIPLGGRVAIARQARADLFISIHADSAPNPEARGASVYTLSATASDAIAARLAARENKADIIGGVNLGVESPEIADIMIDLSRRATGNVSVAFAETLQDSLSDGIAFRGEFHHYAAFYVLKAPDVPSVLLETGYVTNAEDAEFLFSDSGRRRVAQGIARAIERHLLGH